MPLQPGQILNNRYRIVKLLGQGGFGAVYRAWDLNLDSACALKENLDTSAEAQKQFRREAVILANLHHPNLPGVRDHFIIPGQGQYLVMDYVEGDDLQGISRLHGSPLPESQVIPWIEQICDALEYLHSQNPPIIHRDIKPANIKITPQGQAMLVDFGIAKVYDPNLDTTMGARAVTPGYSPHEQYGKGKTDARTDVYALGATLYNLLTGQLPVESIQRVVHDSLVPPEQLNPTISRVTSAAIRQAMQIDPARRQPDATALKAALKADPAVVSYPPVSKTVPAQAYPTSKPLTGPATTQPFPLGKLKKWLPLIGIAALLVVCVAVVGIGYYGFGLFGGQGISPTEEVILPPGSTQLTASPSPQVVNQPSPTPSEMISTPVFPPGVLFLDDFSDPASGWNRNNDARGKTDYNDGAYQIYVNDPSTDIWANPNQYFDDTVITVEATKTDGPDKNDFGIICRYQDSQNFYYLAISSDGYFGIFKVANGMQALIGMDKMQYSEAIHRGNATNQLRADCIGETLVLYANDQDLMVVTDPQYSSGDVGLIAGTFNVGGTDILFDNFVVKKP